MFAPARDRLDHGTALAGFSVDQLMERYTSCAALAVASFTEYFMRFACSCKSTSQSARHGAEELAGLSVASAVAVPRAARRAGRDVLQVPDCSWQLGLLASENSPRTPTRCLRDSASLSFAVRATTAATAGQRGEGVQEC